MKNGSKNIFIIVSEGSIARNILRSFVLDNILKDQLVLVYLLYKDPDLSK